MNSPDKRQKKQRKKAGTLHSVLARLRRWLRRLVIVLAVLFCAPFVLTVLYKGVAPVSTLMVHRVVTLQGYQRQWVPLSQIDSDVVRSVMASEDAQFCSHGGVDWQSLRQVIEDWRAGKRVRGASTLSMQMAKNLFLWPSRSYVRKGLEVPLALYMDAVLGKPRLMEIYLNTAEWGPEGVFGIEAAAQRVYGKPAINLSTNEAALLTVMLPNPVERDAARPSGRLRTLAATVRARANSAALDSSCVLG